ncbi:uncharacterized protein LOC116012048 [Ipomoea triloba]|uniref:uncharacterized protein LOC116012048 n=1 Tax=Ipomoea triloba TaxID=35885 RepID=UPI00125DCA1F|nr:uncharacterized protein LOC116012048 [Ipomoea triloba]
MLSDKSRLLIGEVDDVRPWNRIWDLQVCHLCGSVQESAYHLFVECQEVGTLWSSICLPVLLLVPGNLIDWFFELIALLDEEKCSKFIMLRWGLWGNRNEKVWNGVSVDLNIMKCKALTFLANWKYANGLEEITHTVRIVEEKWKAPMVGRFKLNTDASLDPGNNIMGFGWVLRDEDGRFLAAKSMHVMGNYAVKKAEAVRIREALSWLKDTGLGDIDVDVGNISRRLLEEEVARGMNKSFKLVQDSTKELIIHLEDVTWEKNLASTISGVEFHFAKRSANRAAHTIAREVVS